MPRVPLRELYIRKFPIQFNIKYFRDGRRAARSQGTARNIARSQATAGIDR